MRTVITAAGWLLRQAGGAWGIFILINAAGDWLRPGFAVTHLWIGASYLPGWVLPVLLPIAGGVLLWHLFTPIRPRPLQIGGALIVAAVTACTGVNAVQYYHQLANRVFATPVAVPASLFFFAFLALLALQIFRVPDKKRPVGGAASVLGFGLVALVTAAAFPLLLFFTLGPSDYARQADCAVVFGAGVRPDGAPSLSLADRVDKGIRLYKDRTVKTLIMSGGYDRTSRYSEPNTMLRRAVQAGVPKDDIILDREGDNTAATVINTAAIFRRKNYRTVLAVSHYYHLPRIKMLYQRAGVRVYLVPATKSRRLAKEPYFLLREIAAFYNSLFFQ